MDYKNLAIRTASGAVLVAAIVAATVDAIDPAPHWIFLAVFGIITTLATREFMHINGARPLTAWLAAAASLLLFGAAFCFESFTRLSRPLLTVYLGLMLCLFLSNLWTRDDNHIAASGRLALSQIYVALPFMFMAQLRHYGQAPMLLALFVLIWANDTFAFLTGSLIGRHRMIERISPKKTWEGFTGGCIFAIAAGCVFDYLYPAIALWKWALIAVTVVVAGTLGDLVESQMKRTLGIKDSGRAIPGHGGWLDRFDSSLVAAAALAILLLVI